MMVNEWLVMVNDWLVMVHYGSVHEQYWFKRMIDVSVDKMVDSG